MSSPSGTEASTTSSSPNSVVATAGAGGNNAPKYGTLVPNRIFVGGISGSTTEAELTQLFSAYGNVRATKIINDRAGVSKGYGFVTFETEEEARRLQAEGDCIVLKERKLNIAPAIKKQAAAYPLQPYNRSYETAPTVPSGTVFFHNGYPYTYQNGMAFFATSANGTQDVATAAANGYVAASPYPQPQPPPTYPATTVMFQQPMYIPQQYQYQALPPSSPIPSPYMYASASSSPYGTTNGNGGGGNGSGGGGSSSTPSMPPAPSSTSGSNHHHSQPPSGAFYSAIPPQGVTPSLALPPPPPNHHHHHHQQAAQVAAMPEMYMTGPTTAIYAQQTAYPMPIPEIYETPPMTELSSAQSTEDSSSNSSRSGPSNQSNDSLKVNGESSTKIPPSTPVVSLLRLTLGPEGEDNGEGARGGEGGGAEGAQDDDARQRHQRTFRSPASQQQTLNNSKRGYNANAISNHHRYRVPHHRPNQMHPNNTSLTQPPIFYLAPNYMQGPNQHSTGYYAPPPPPPHHHHHLGGGGGAVAGGRGSGSMSPHHHHDQRQHAPGGIRSRHNHHNYQRPQHAPSPPEGGKKYSQCPIPEGILSCSPPLQAPSALVYAPTMGMASTPGVGMGRQPPPPQQQRRYGNGPRRQGGGNRNYGGGGGGDTMQRQVQVLTSAQQQQRQRVGKCNKTVKCSRQGPSMSGSVENMPRDGSGDAPCVPLTPPGTPSPGSAVDRTPVSSVGPDPVCQMQALSL
ncbi:uncharacterized protein [Hetaerina americana]|uniref:uncharacterized protein n=1 Tax=Hetaerina americana TaxID=62018 RepID=UPI003A7F168D